MTAGASMVPGVGTAAPDFTLTSTAGSDVTLSALRGKKVLLAFFPLAFTRVCTLELCEIRDEWDAFERSDTVVLPISVDSSATLAEYRRQLAVQTDFLSDFKRTASRAYGILLEDRYHSARAYFLIDPAGIVRWAHVEAKTGQKRSNEELLAEIARIS